MTNKVNWQEPNTSDNKQLRLLLLGGWIKHISKIIFCLAFMFICFYYLVFPQIQVNYLFASTKCLIVAKNLVPLSKKISNSGFQPKFLAMYEINKKLYTSWTYDVLNNIYTNPNAYQAVANEFKTGNYYVCWYDANNPHKIALKRGWDHISLLFFFMTIVVFITSITSFWRWFRKRKDL